MQQVGRGADFPVQLLNQLLGGLDLSGQLGIAGRSALLQLRESHAENGQGLAGAVVKFTSEVASFVVLRLQKLPGKIAHLIAMLHQFSASLFQLPGTNTDFRIQGLGKSSKSFFTVAQCLIGPLAFDGKGELACDGETDFQFVAREVMYV